MRRAAFSCSSEGELRGPVDGNEEVEPAFLRPDLGNVRRTPWLDVDLEVADRVALELGALGLVTLSFGKAADAMTLEAAVKARAGQVRKRGLESVEAVVQRQQRVAAEGNDHGLVLGRQDR